MVDATVPHGSRGSSLSLPSLVISVVDGPDSGVSVEMSARRFTVGTAPDNALVLSDRSVSRHHLSLEARADGVVLRDLASTNGTRVDGVSIVEAIAEAGRRVQLGASTLELSVARRPLAIPLSPAGHFGGLVGHSVAMRELYAILERASTSDASILLHGETGVGKELAAEAIHEASPRSDGPFVVVDCGAIPPALFESELFGHVRGAFTGAVRDRPGLLLEADGGTVFLDEIGELAPESQPKMLRALETRTVRPVGAPKAVPIDVRVVAASHRDLEAEVNRGAFREDLFFRLAVLRVRLPALRERLEDVPELVRLFVERMAPDRIDDASDIVDALVHRTFPGNVRELRNAVEELLVLGITSAAAVTATTSTPATALPERVYGMSYKQASEAALSAFQREYVTRLLRRTDGNVSRAAREADMSRRYLQRLINELGLSGL